MVRPSTPAARRVLALVAVPLLLGFGASGTPTASATSPSLSDLQQQVADARAAYEASRVRVDGLSQQAARLDETADQAEAAAAQWRDRVADQDGGFFHAVGDAISPGESDLDRAADAADNAEHARELADMVQGALADAIAETEQDRHDLEKAQARQLRVEARWTAAEYATSMINRSQFAPAYSATGAQDTRNRAALRAWESYVRRVAAAAVVPPPARDLADPARLAAPLEQVRDRHNTAVPGVAEVDPPGRTAVPVVPTETVRAVAEGFHRVGLPSVPGDVDTTAYACGGLVANAFGTSLTLPGDVTTQWDELRAVPRDTLQIGDVVVLGSRRDGLAQTALYVGQQRVIVADPTTGTAGVQPLPARLLGVRRATLATDSNQRAVPTTGVCAPAVPVTTSSDGSGPLQVPLAPGSYRLSAGFGDPGTRWSSGEHTGQDLAAPTGTPVVAAAAGTVTVEHPGWAGNLVRIDHGGGVETWYAHLSRVDVTDGQAVGAGDPVGQVGALGNTTGPHLHLEVLLDGTAVDPTKVLHLPEAPQPTYPNGEVPLDALCTATSDGAQLLRCDAAVAFRLMSASFEEDNGEALCITDSYRSREGQERAHVLKPSLTATPGTSVHGWGLAVDLCGGVERFDTAEHAWLLAHGPAYGWNHPAWAEPGGSRPEPWHFEYDA